MEILRDITKKNIPLQSQTLKFYGVSLKPPYSKRGCYVTVVENSLTKTRLSL